MQFKNHYFALRHGESTPNVRGIIVSDLEEGKKDEYALTRNGEEQVLRSAREAKENALLGADTVIYSSPFSRCRRTAEIARDTLGVKTDIVFDDRLRERWFGDFEGMSNENFRGVWDKDAADSGHKEANVESTEEVVRRTVSLIRDLEEKYSGKNILLVSHCDTLQILQTFFEGRSPSVHRSIAHLKEAEMRRLG